MFKLIHRVGFFLVCLLLSIQGFSAQVIKVDGKGGGLGITGPKGKTFVFYGEMNGEVSIEECITNRTFFENSRYDCTQKEGTQIETLSQADFRNHLKFVLNWFPIQKYDAAPQINLELWRKYKSAVTDIGQLRGDPEGIKVHLAQIERVIRAYGAESADMEEKQALEWDLVNIEFQLEAHSDFDKFDRRVNKWIDGLMAVIMSSEFFIVYDFAQYKRDFRFNVLRGAIQFPIHFNTNFIRLEPDLFLMGSPPSEKGRSSDDEYQHYVTLEYAFEMQATEETQFRWAYVMGYNPSRFQKKEHCPDTHMEIEIRGGPNKVSLCPTYPVEQVSWWSVVVYVNRLSELMGLTPVYDLSDIEFEGIAAKGTLEATRGELRINAPDDNNIYNTKGFRLPTEAEWEYAARGGTTTAAFGLGENISVDMANYNGRYPYQDAAEGIARGQTVSVMSLSSVNGFGFSHMHGNVWEWVHDWYHLDYYHDSPEKNPLGPSDGGVYRVVRGGGWYSEAVQLRSANRNNREFTSNYSDIGFRLVRTVQ